MFQAVLNHLRGCTMDAGILRDVQKSHVCDFNECYCFSCLWMYIVQAISMRYAIHHILPNCVPSYLLQYAHLSRIIPSLVFPSSDFQIELFRLTNEPSLKNPGRHISYLQLREEENGCYKTHSFTQLRLEKLAPCSAFFTPKVFKLDSRSNRRHVLRCGFKWHDIYQTPWLSLQKVVQIFPVWISIWKSFKKNSSFRYFSFLEM